MDGGAEGLDDRKRIDRWLQETRHLLGQTIPAYLDDRDRTRARLESAERENDQLRAELAAARREASDLRAALTSLRTERATVLDSFKALVAHLTALQKSTTDISRHLESVVPTSGAGKS
jgi:chromosome segregation ATPase